MIEQDQKLTLRYHHLSFWSFISDGFLTRSGRRKPWELTQDESDNLFREFAEDFAYRFASELDRDRLINMKYLEDGVEAWMEDEPRIREERIRYCDDVLGKTDDERDKYTNRLADYVHQLLIETRRDKDTLLILSREPDGICRSCVVGNHCTDRSRDRTILGDRNHERAILHMAVRRFDQIVLVNKNYNGLQVTLPAIKLETLFDDLFFNNLKFFLSALG